jgi:hypothetical protein
MNQPQTGMVHAPGRREWPRGGSLWWGRMNHPLTRLVHSSAPGWSRGGPVMGLVAGLEVGRGAQLRAQPGAGDGASPRFAKIFLLPAPQGVARDLAPAMPARVRADTGGGGRCRGTAGPADTLASPASWRTGRGVGGGCVGDWKVQSPAHRRRQHGAGGEAFPTGAGRPAPSRTSGRGTLGPLSLSMPHLPLSRCVGGPRCAPDPRAERGSTARRPRSGSKGRPRPVPAGE